MLPEVLGAFSGTKAICRTGEMQLLFGNAAFRRRNFSRGHSQLAVPALLFGKLTILRVRPCGVYDTYRNVQIFVSRARIIGLAAPRANIPTRYR